MHRIGESTNIVDGDLSVLTGLPRLRVIGIQNRRHPRPTVPASEASS